MGQMTVVTCDSCATIAEQTVTIKVGNQNLVKDLCKRHLDELLSGARQPRPGRRAGMLASDIASTTMTEVAPKRRRGRPRKSEVISVESPSKNGSGSKEAAKELVKEPAKKESAKELAKTA